jgi:hypothetical protein
MADKHDCADAEYIAELESLIAFHEAVQDAGLAVVAAWESGDLAGVVNDLRIALEEIPSGERRGRAVPNGQ